MGSPVSSPDSPFGTPLSTPRVRKYVPPSLAKAQQYIDDHHPRMVDVRTGARKPFSVLHTRMGRHCFMCCRKLDPFSEGIESWFTEFGSGVTLCVLQPWWC